MGDARQARRKGSFQAWDVLCVQGMERMQSLRIKSNNELKDARQLVADLINEGNAEKGMKKVAEVIKLHHTSTATGILESFLNMLRTPIDMLSNRTEIPEELRAELLSLVFASTRWPDVPELEAVRKAFEVFFGADAFAEVTKDEVEPNCGVQDLLLKCLSSAEPSIADKVSMADGIMHAHGTVKWSRAQLEAAAGGAVPVGCESADEQDDSAHEGSHEEIPRKRKGAAAAAECSDAFKECNLSEIVHHVAVGSTDHGLYDPMPMLPQYHGASDTTGRIVLNDITASGLTYTHATSAEVLEELLAGCRTHGQPVLASQPVCANFSDEYESVTVSDCPVYDAKLVCEGEGCSVIFSNVQFKNCFVKVLRGAHVAFLGCSFTDTADCFDDLFVYAADAGSRITITDCTFSSGVGGVAVQDGAHATITSCQFVALQKICVHVHGPETVLEMSSCKLDRYINDKAEYVNDFYLAGREDFVGVAVLENASVELSKIDMSDLERGVIVQNAVAQLQECTSWCVATGYIVCNKGQLALMGCSNNRSAAPLVAVERFTLHIEQCEFKNFMDVDLQSRGVLMHGPGSAVVKDSKFTGVEKGQPQVALPNSFRERYTPALVSLWEEVDFTMDKCVLSKSSNCGIHILKNYSSRVMISNCQLSQACYFGIKAAASQTEVQVIDCTMKENRQYGAGCVDATIHACRCHGSGNGWGAFHAKASGVFGEPCCLVLKKCSSCRDLCGFSCEGCPTQPDISPHLTLEEMLVRRSKLAGFAFKHHVRGTMSNCAALQCGSNGIEFWGNGHARFKVYDCTSRQNAGCGVHVASGAGVNNVLLEKVSCANNKGAGFEVENPNSRLRLKESLNNLVPYESEGVNDDERFILESCDPPGRALAKAPQLPMKPTRGNQPGSGKGSKRTNKKKGGKKR